MNPKIEIDEILKRAPVPSAHGHPHHRFTSIRTAQLFAVLLIVLGISCMFFTEHIHAVFPLILGIIMVSHGLCKIYCGILTQEHKRPETKLTSNGIVLVILGCVILYHHKNADSIIGAIWGVIGLSNGLETINIAICHNFEKKPFIGKIIHGGIELLLGILLLLDPLEAVEHHLFILGIELCAVGIRAVRETKQELHSIS